jgi:thioredoxin-like negative regulator of GroEL
MCTYIYVYIRIYGYSNVHSYIHIQPILEKLANSQTTLKIAKIDATVHTKISEKLDIKSFPTIKYVKNGILGDYKGMYMCLCIYVCMYL